MLGYKLDSFQIAVIVLFCLFTILNMALPYELDLETGEYSYGVGSIFNWIVNVILLRVSLHLFGREIFSLNPYLAGIGVTEFTSLYIKILTGNGETSSVVWSGLVIPFLVLIVLVAVLYIERAFYTLERR